MAIHQFVIRKHAGLLRAIEGVQFSIVYDGVVYDKFGEREAPPPEPVKAKRAQGRERHPIKARFDATGYKEQIIGMKDGDVLRYTALDWPSIFLPIEPKVKDLLPGDPAPAWASFSSCLSDHAKHWLGGRDNFEIVKDRRNRVIEIMRTAGAPKDQE